MLVGSFKYGGYVFGLRGYDFGDNISLYLSCPIVKSQKLIDSGIQIGDDVIPATWNDLYLSIGIGFIKADCYTETEDGVKYKNRLNVEALSRLGSIVRGMKSGVTRDKLISVDLFNVGFNPTKFMEYEFDSGKIKMQLGIINELKYVGEDGVEVELSEDGSYTDKIWKNTSTQHKFKLDLSEFVTKSIDASDDWDFSSEVGKIFSLQEIINKNPDKSYVWLNERKYHVVKTIEEVEQVCKKIWQHKGLVAFDTETTGLNVNITSRQGIGDRLVGMVFCIEPGEAYYFPIAHKKIQNICTPGNEAFIIEKYFKPILEQKDILCHNGSYDWKVMYNYGICTNIKHDTLILFKVTMWNDNRNLGLGLKKLTHTFLNRDSFELSDFVEGKFGEDNIKFWDFDEESTKYYACPDTDNLLELYEYTVSQDLLGKYDAKKTYEIEVLFSIVIAYQEYYGHYVDTSKIDDLVAAIKRDKEETYKQMVDYVGMDFNPKSSSDMQKICFEKLKLPIIDYTDAGNPSTGKDTRKAWLNSSNVSEENKTFIKNLNKFLDARTLESNFTNNIDKFATVDGLMFSVVQQFLETGRVSTKNPNYQGYSDVVKKHVGPRPGYYAMDADYSSVEARIMCSMAGCTGMIEKLKDPDADYHRLKASDMFGVPYELVTDLLRKMSKGVNFGILYGLGDPNLGANLFGVKSPENTRKAKKQKELYFKGMEELKGFIEYSRNQGTSNNFSTTFFKRRRYYDPRTTRKDTIERQSCNARIQGTAADIYKLAMVRLFLEIKNRGWMGKVLISAFVHDECYLEISKEIDPFVMLSVLRKCMMLEIEGWCPLFIGAGFGRTWYEAKKTEIPVQVQEYLVNTYGETGVDWWQGDTAHLCNWVVNSIMEYKRDRVRDYIKNEDNWGKVLKPAENELAHSLLSDMKRGIKVEGAIDTEINPSKDMIENLKEFARVFDCLDVFEQANIQAPAQAERNNLESDEEDEVLQREDDIDPHKVLLMRLNMIGVHSAKTGDGTKIYFKYHENDPVFMKLVRGTIDKHSGEIEVIAIKDDGCEYTTGLTTSMAAYPKLLQLYLSRNNVYGK